LTFLDTNVLVHAFDASEPAKRARAVALFEVETPAVVVSAHVLNEFYCEDSQRGSAAAPPPRQASASAERIVSAQRATRSSLRSASLSSSMTRPTN
jgi:predicted nucleic acid-binding protein